MTLPAVQTTCLPACVIPRSPLFFCYGLGQFTLPHWTYYYRYYQVADFILPSGNFTHGHDLFEPSTVLVPLLLCLARQGLHVPVFIPSLPSPV